MKVEPLQFILDRAASTPLKLEIQWPAMEGTLELIASHSSAIQILEVKRGFYEDVKIDRFLTLNLSSLSELRIGGLDDNKRDILLDLALDWNRDNLTLCFDVPVTAGIHPVFDHKLMQRVIYLDITFNQ
jgi:hypothetical protein